MFLQVLKQIGIAAAGALVAILAVKGGEALINRAKKTDEAAKTS